MMSLDSAKDFYELTQLKIKNPKTGLFMIGGGVPKNFAQDIVVAAEILGFDVPMHKYAVQITVADVRDGALSSSTLKEAIELGQRSTSAQSRWFTRRQRSRAAHRRLRLPQGRLEKPARAQLRGSAR